MSKAKKNARKELRTKIAERLTINFGDLKERISEKKFERRIQKASKLLSQGIKLEKAAKPEKKKTLKKVTGEDEQKKAS
jgi:hypothetical protein